MRRLQASVFSGFLIIMEIPRLINGLEKSITRSRIEDIVRGARARSASCKDKHSVINLK